tara:strand:+ start:2643 stop:2981 length:339 start_codon:yes stop_codon:yes gene_type:complete
MGKPEISWIGLINALIAERKKEGKPAGVKDVMGEAKSQWTKIKAGNHDKYIQGKPNTRKNGKNQKNKTSKFKKNQKNQKNQKNKNDMCDSANDILNACKLCKHCTKEIKKLQ